MRTRRYFMMLGFSKKDAKKLRKICNRRYQEMRKTYNKG
jgi:hypothetical protein